MKLQVAFDDITNDRCFEILKGCAESIDIIEIGTLFLLRNGLEPLRTVKRLYPEKTVLADAKIMDAPEKMAKDCFEAGADIVTVMSVSGDKTVSRAIEIAKDYKKAVFADLLYSQDPAEDALLMDRLGAEYICFHSSATDRSLVSNISYIKKRLSHAEIAFAGGINRFNVREYICKKPDILIVGSGITGADNPCEEVNIIKGLLL